MSLHIVLEDECGEPIKRLTDDKGAFRAILPRPNDKTYQCLRFIDPHGDAVFNNLQMDQFMEELERVGLNAGPEVSAVIQNVRSLAQECGGEIHLYLKFYGD